MNADKLMSEAPTDNENMASTEIVANVPAPAATEYGEQDGTTIPPYGIRTRGPRAASLPHRQVQIQMNEAQHGNPLHGITLQAMVEHLVERYGWDGLGARITIRCFTHDPSVNSSLKFLRKTPWARAKVESLYLHSVAHPRKSAAAPPADQPRPGPNAP